MKIHIYADDERTNVGHRATRMNFGLVHSGEAYDQCEAYT